MRKGFIYQVLAIVLMPLSVMAIELTDYTDPDLYYQDAELRATFNLKDGNQDQTSFNGSAKLQYDMEYSTLPLKWLIHGEGRTDFSRGGSDADSTVKNHYLEPIWSSVNKYLKEIDETFVFGRVDLGYHDLEGSEDDDPLAKVTGGIGYGRVFTATPLMETKRCVEDLIRYGVITQDLSDAAYLEFAKIIAKEREYKSKYSAREYEKYWYEAMEEVLRKEGVLKNDTLGAMGVIRIQDILTKENPLDRYHGWEAKAGLGYLLSDYSGNEGDPILTASFEYTLPYGWQWQFREMISYSTILEDWEFGDTDHNLNNELSATYEISYSVDWINRWMLDLTLPSESEEDDSIDNTLESILRFYITNTVDLEVGIRFFNHDKGDNEDDDIVTTVFFDVVYTIF